MFLWHIHRFETILNSKATMTCDFECGTKMIDIGGKSLQDKFALQRHQEMEICFFFENHILTSLIGSSLSKYPINSY